MIREIVSSDREQYLSMVSEFYASPAVTHTVPAQYFENTFNELMRSDTYTFGYILEQDGKTAGYALLSKSYSQEAGGIVLWVEELYILPEFRSMGLGKEFFAFLEAEKYFGAKRVRLEVTKDNARAQALYKSLDFEPLPYLQMILEL
ncbi:MAG: GNAT family N-acetyltransferase [Oscillospiraceae bacterium]